MNSTLAALFPPQVIFIGYGFSSYDGYIHNVEISFALDPRYPSVLRLIESELSQRDRLLAIQGSPFRIKSAPSSFDRLGGLQCYVISNERMPEGRIIFLVLDPSFNGTSLAIRQNDLIAYFRQIEDLMSPPSSTN